ncbi:MAG: copper chaperone PCu(A)C [Alphaproteobacteria bacterium]|nr:copper chaperone PCu(A)C [Alphaproteobacteria bacterium]
MRPAVPASPRLAALRVAGIVLAALPWLANPAGATEFSVGDVTVTDPWSRATAPTAPTGVAFMTLSTSGDTDRLIAADSPIADIVELHTHRMDESGIMRMRPVEVIDIAPGEPARLAPGGLHIMMIGLQETLVRGERFPLTLTFEEAGTLEIFVPVAGPGASGPPDSPN